jgi:hypothetical protein
MIAWIRRVLALSGSKRGERDEDDPIESRPLIFCKISQALLLKKGELFLQWLSCPPKTRTVGRGEIHL